MSNIRTANNSDFRKLMDSYSNKDINKFRKLIDEGININCLNSNGKSFISCMLMQDHDDIMDKFLSILLKNNVSLKQIGVEKSLLNIVIKHHDNTSCLEKLLKNNININNFGVYKISTHGYKDCPAIFQAIDKENHNVIDLLLKYNVDLNIENQYGETPLLFLLKGGFFYKYLKSSVFIMEKLLENGADADILGEDGDTAIHYMVRYPHFSDMFEVLFKYKHNININAKNRYSNTALREAVKYGNSQAVEFLIKKGANLNIQDMHGFTAAMLAVNINSIQILSFILKQSPDLSIVNDNGDNILHILAKSRKHKKYKMQYFDQISESHPELLNIKNSTGHVPCALL